MFRDDEVMLVNWRGGVLRQIAVYDNDENGIALFAEHLTKHRYRNMGFFVVANVVGEDYRHEKVAHLTGKNKIDFHNRRFAPVVSRQFVFYVRYARAR